MTTEAPLPPNVLQLLLDYQRNEITEYHIYRNIAAQIKDEANRRIIERIASEELGHYRTWQHYTHREVKPDRRRIFKYTTLSRLFGFTFAAKLMEKGESAAQANYEALIPYIPAAKQVMDDEDAHEQQILALLDEEHLRYTGSMVLGLNDALVELTGALAGFTLALQDTRLIALTGSITGIAAALSMAASEYLSTKAEGNGKEPLKASIYTGVAYILTVLLLIAPYLLFENYYLCLAAALFLAVLIIAIFNYYIAIAKDESFRSRFLEMTGLSFGVALFSFFVGYLLRTVFHIEV